MALNRPVKVGIVGLMYGRYGLLPGLIGKPEIEVVALCSTRIDVAKDVARAHGVAQAYANWQTMLDEAQLDMVMVAVDPKTSGPICEYAIQRGIAVFAEKLPSHDIECTRRLAGLASALGVPTCVDYIFPELHTFRAAKKLLVEKSLGTLRLVELEWVFESDDHRNALSTWKTDPALGGGLLRHFLVHALHYIEWFFGGVCRVHGVLQPSEWPAVGDTYASLLLQTSSGLTINVIASSAISYDRRHRLSVWGDQGAFELCNNGEDPVRDFELLATIESAKSILLKESDCMELPMQLDSRVAPSGRLSASLVSRLSTGLAANAPDFSDAVRAHELIDAITKSNNNGRTIHVS